MVKNQSNGIQTLSKLDKGEKYFDDACVLWYGDHDLTIKGKRFYDFVNENIDKFIYVPSNIVEQIRKYIEEGRTQFKVQYRWFVVVNSIDTIRSNGDVISKESLFSNNTINLLSKRSDCSLEKLFPMIFSAIFQLNVNATKQHFTTFSDLTDENINKCAGRSWIGGISIYVPNVYISIDEETLLDKYNLLDNNLMTHVDGFNPSGRSVVTAGNYKRLDYKAPDFSYHVRPPSTLEVSRYHLEDLHRANANLGPLIKHYKLK